MAWRVSFGKPSHAPTATIAAPQALLQDGFLVHSRAMKDATRIGALIVILGWFAFAVHPFLTRSI